MKLLILGYGSYGEYLFNSCIDVAVRLERDLSRLLDTDLAILRVSLKDVMDYFRKAVPKKNPDIIVGMGMYPGAHTVILEAAAINIASYSTPDADRKRFSYKKLYPEEPLVLTLNFSAETIIDRCRDQRNEIIIGLSPGTYLCNVLAYNIYRWSRKTGRYGLFFHIPITTDDAMKNNLLRKNIYGMPVNDVVRSITCVISELLRSL